MPLTMQLQKSERSLAVKPFRDEDGWYHYTPPKPMTWSNALLIVFISGLLWVLALGGAYLWLVR